MDEARCEADHAAEAFVDFVGMHGNAFEFFELTEKVFD
ncbi:hypothetical protein GGR01_001535 [Acetobacter oeni]|nr:hypothetical protein [Acetobacter oeni]